MLANYKETLRLVSKHLGTIDDLQAYCKQHELNYQIAINVKNGKTDKPYPIQLEKILKSFGYKVSIKKVIMFTFSLKNSKSIKIKSRK